MSHRFAIYYDGYKLSITTAESIHDVAVMVEYEYSNSEIDGIVKLDEDNRPVNCPDSLNKGWKQGVGGIAQLFENIKMKEDNDG